MRRSIILVSSALVAALSANASALTLHIDSMAKGKYAEVKIKYKKSTLDVYAGAIDVHFNHGKKFEAYCVDLDHTNKKGDSYGVDLFGTNVIAHGDKVRKLYEAYAPKVNSADKGAALQLAIWDEIVDGGDGFSKGQLKSSKMSKNILKLANDILKDPIPTNPVHWDTFVIKDADDSDGFHRDCMEVQHQALISGVPCPVPEPASVFALAVGFVGIARVRRNKRS